VTVPPRDEAVFGAGLKLVDLRGRLKDFLDTAAAVAELDLVIAVDTSVAHLAGALAKPVWTLLPYTPDWRWLMARSDSPWYPTMRLFRQAQRGQWPPVIRQVAEALEHFPATHPR
jgi:ADP-heptose:LPS heptosyltransferase